MQAALRIRTIEDYDVPASYVARSRPTAAPRHVRVVEVEEREAGLSLGVRLMIIVGGAIAGWAVPIALATSLL